MTRILRLLAIAIAIAGAIDPAITVSGAARARLAVVATPPASAAAAAVRARLVRDLSSSYDIASTVTSDAVAAIVIGERYPAEAVSAALLVATVTMPAPVVTGARIVGVNAPREVPNASLIHLDVDVEYSSAAGQTTEVTAVIAGLEVGRASHRWAAGESRWRASLDAVPVGDPPYLVQVRLPPSPGGFGGTGKPDTSEPSAVADADVVVEARRAPFRVEFYDPRPSWATTFVRRALEADPRFVVAALSFTSRGIAAQTGSAVPIADPRLDAFDVVIVGGLDRLSTADARALERFMRERGGAVVVVPDQRIDAGAARDLIFGPASAFADGLRPELDERLLEQPAKLVVTPPAASLQASELLVLRAPAPGTDVSARVSESSSSPVITSAPRGDGRLLFSGAMDAWRFRAADNGAFDRFWQSTIAGLALAAPPPIAIDFEPPLLRPGGRGQVRVRVRASEVTAVSASLDDQPIRLRPAPEAGVYRGAFVAKTAAGRSTLDVRAAAAQTISASRTLLVRPDVQPAPAPVAPPLSLLSSSHRGIDVTPDRVPELERFVRSAVAAPPAPIVRQPMRSAWWALAIALCLSAEWWLRRRRGLR